MIKDIAFSAYGAKDVRALRDFYATTLGFTFTGQFEENGVLKYDEAQVGNSWFAVMTNEWTEIHPSGGIAFEVDDIEKTLADLKSKGIAAGDVYETPVCKISSFSDPEGNKVTLHQSTVTH